MALRKFEDGDIAIINDKVSAYDRKNYGLVPGTEVKIEGKGYEKYYIVTVSGHGRVHIASGSLDKGTAKTNRDKFLEQIEKAEDKIQATKAFIQETRMKLEFLDEIQSDEFSENEFKAYQTLTIIEQSGMTKLEKAKAIAQLISKK
jgi:hypothetical protein